MHKIACPWNNHFRNKLFITLRANKSLSFTRLIAKKKPKLEIYKIYKIKHQVDTEIKKRFKKRD